MLNVSQIQSLFPFFSDVIVESLKHLGNCAEEIQYLDSLVKLK